MPPPDNAETVQEQPTPPDNPETMEAPPLGFADGAALGLRASMKAIKAGERSPAKLQAISAAAEQEDKGATSETVPADKETPKVDGTEAPVAPEAEPTAQETTTEEAPPATPETATPAAEASEHEIRTLPRREQARIKTFIEKTKAAETAQKAAEEKVSTLEKQLAELQTKSATLPEDVQKQLEELTRYRRRFDLENDPEVKQRFDTRMQASEASIREALKSSPLSGPWLEERLKEHGSFRAFVTSKKTYAIRSDNDTGRESVTGQDVFKRLLESLPPIEADIVRATLADQARTEKERSAFIDTESAKAKEYFDGVEKQASERQTQWTTRLKKTEEGARAVVNDAVTKLDWLKDVSVPADASADVKTRIGEDNKFRAMLRQDLQGIFSNPVIVHAAAMVTDAKAAEDFRNLLLDANRVAHVDRELERATKEIERLKNELKVVRGATATTTRVGVVPRATPTAAANGVPPKNDGESTLAYSIRLSRLGLRPPAEGPA